MGRNTNMHSSVQSDQAFAMINGIKAQQQPKKQMDIEDQEFIYKVPCAARETISLRDSQYVSK